MNTYIGQSYRWADRYSWSKDRWPGQFGDLDVDPGGLRADHRGGDSVPARIARVRLQSRMVPILSMVIVGWCW